jgi:hypothetical protein
MSLEPATLDDIPAIRAIELNADYALFIGNFSAEAHAANMASNDYRYFAWRQDGRLVAFAILAKLTDPADIVLLKRLGSSVTDTGLSRRIREHHGQPVRAGRLQRQSARRAGLSP